MAILALCLLALLLLLVVGVNMASVDDLVAEVSALRASYDALKARVDAIIGAPPAEDPRVAQAVVDLKAQQADQDAFHA